MEHASLSTSIRDHCDGMYVNSESRTFHFASYAFDASIYEVFSTLSCGGCVCVPSHFDRMNNLAGFIQTQRINWVTLTPSSLALLQPDDVPSLRTIVLGGEAVTQENVEIWASKVTLINGYGPAEATICALGLIPERGWKSGTISRMVGAVSWITIPSDSSRLAPIGAVGELVIEGPVVGRGYLNNPEKTAAAFITTPPWRHHFRGEQAKSSRLYRTGDLMQYTSDVCIRFVGRKDTQVKLRGQRIELGEVEHQTLQSFPGAKVVVAEVVVPAEENRSPFLAAFIWCGHDEAEQNLLLAPDDQFRSAAREAESHLNGLVPVYMVPAVFFSLAFVPFSMTGKTDRRRLRDGAALLSRPEIESYSNRTNSAKKKPSTPLEEILQKVWADVLSLSCEDIGTEDDFFRLGGDSIAAMKASARSRAAGVELTVADIFRCQTILGLALGLEKGELTPRNSDENITASSDVSSTPQNLIQSALEQIRDKARTKMGVSDAEIEDAYPCSPIQHMMLTAQLKTAEHYAPSQILEIVSTDSRPIDLAKLQSAWQTVINRHAALRTIFVHDVAQGVGSVQVVIKQAAGSIQVVGESEGNVWEIHRKMPRKDYNKENGLLHKLTLCKVSPEKAILHMEISHALIDAVSESIFLDELCLAYANNLPGGTAALYKNYITYLRGKSASDTPFWRKYLEGVQPCLFPTSATCPQGPRKLQHAEIALDKAADAYAFCRRRNITFPNLIKSVWALVLKLWTGMSPVCFGYLNAGRHIDIDGVEKICGPLINLLICRLQIRREDSLGDILDAMQADCHQSLPYLHGAVYALDGFKMIPPSEHAFNTIINHRKQEEPSSVSSAITYRPISGDDGMEVGLFFTSGFPLSCQLGHLLTILTTVRFRLGCR